MTPQFSGAIDHVHLYVPSRKAAAEWYGEILGFTVAKEFEFWATDKGGPLTIVDNHNKIHLALFRSTRLKPVSLAFGTNRKEYAEWKTHLSQIDLSFDEKDHEICHSIYFSDPFGNQLEITTFDLD